MSYERQQKEKRKEKVKQNQRPQECQNQWPHKKTTKTKQTSATNDRPSVLHQQQQNVTNTENNAVTTAEAETLVRLELDRRRLERCITAYGANYMNLFCNVLRPYHAIDAEYAVYRDCRARIGVRDASEDREGHCFAGTVCAWILVQLDTSYETHEKCIVYYCVAADDPTENKFDALTERFIDSTRLDATEYQRQVTHYYSDLMQVTRDRSLINRMKRRCTLSVKCKWPRLVKHAWVL